MQEPLCPLVALFLNLVCFIIGFGSVLINSGLMVNFLFRLYFPSFYEIVLVSPSKNSLFE